MRRKIVVLGLFLFSICIVFFYFQPKWKVPDNIYSFIDIGTFHVPPQKIEVHQSSNFGQSFVPNFENLFMMSVFIPSQNLNKDQTLIFHLRCKPSEDQVASDQDLVTKVWKFREISIKKNNFYTVPTDKENMPQGFHFHFEFPVISDVKNQELYFYFESPDSKPGEGIQIGYWYPRQYYESLTFGAAYSNHQPIEGYLAFRTYHTWKGNFKTLVISVKNRLLTDRVFLIFYGILCVVIFLLLAAVWLKRRRSL
ncbi:MAG: hypothetical protein HYS98_05480 [Deltaproteobacteria bacterium]|nr:hypothetical protein [Deltaproteobacteria bacterium]